jgi:hypothetical protein
MVIDNSSSESITSSNSPEKVGMVNTRSNIIIGIMISDVYTGFTFNGGLQIPEY